MCVFLFVAAKISKQLLANTKIKEEIRTKKMQIEFERMAAKIKRKL